MTIDLDVGFAAPIFDAYIPMIKGSGDTQHVSAAIPIFCLETFYANGGAFYITATSDILLWDKALFIQRISQP